MRLKTYREMIGKSVEECAGELRVSTVTYRAWEKDPNDPKFKDPSPKNKVKIYEWSLGLVPPNDFYSLPDLPDIQSGQTPEGSGGFKVFPAISGGSSLKSSMGRATAQKCSNAFELPGQLSILDCPGVFS